MCPDHGVTDRSPPPPSPARHHPHTPKQTGTEITSIKDVLTDMNIVQKPLTEKGDPRLVHSGFYAAFHSVLQNVYDCIGMVIGQDKDLAADGWTVSEVKGPGAGKRKEEAGLAHQRNARRQAQRTACFIAHPA
jgi:hypothetical protein